MRRVYLDGNATTPPAPEVREAMVRALEADWGNPSSVHADGRRARAVVEDAREGVGRLMGLDARDILFTSGGTEANNLALRALSRPGRALITSKLEHPSVTRVAEELAREGTAVHYARIAESGEIDEEDVLRLLRAHPDSFLALQTVNSETGVVQPLAEIGKIAGELGAEMHVDAIQSWGRLAVNHGSATTLALAAHKFRGPKGIGVLGKTPCVTLKSILFGGSQERGVRPGTLDAVLAAGLLAAVQRAEKSIERYAALGDLRDRLEHQISEIYPRAFFNGRDAATRAPHVTNVSFLGISGPELVAALDLEGVSVSSGSACSAGTSDPSPVITAMAGEARARSAVRFSLGDWVTEDDIDVAVSALRKVLSRASG